MKFLLCVVPTCVETGHKLSLFPTQLSKNRWKPEYLYPEIDYNTQTSTWKLFLNLTVLQAIWGVELLEETTNLEAFWKLNEVKTHT